MVKKVAKVAGVHLGCFCFRGPEEELRTISSCKKQVGTCVTFLPKSKLKNSLENSGTNSQFLQDQRRIIYG